MSTSSKFVDDHIKGAFVSDYVFNLSQKTLSPLQTKVLENIQFSIDEVDLCKDISNFSSKTRCKWFFKNERHSPK